MNNQLLLLEWCDLYNVYSYDLCIYSYDKCLKVEVWSSLLVNLLVLLIVLLLASFTLAFLFNNTLTYSSTSDNSSISSTNY